MLAAGHARCAACGSRRAAAARRCIGVGVGGDDAQPHEPAHDARLPRGLPQGPRRRAAHDRAVERELRRCPLLSLPNNKLIPDARWILDTVGQRDIVARSQARADVAQGLAHAREPHQARQRRRLPARQRRVLRGDRRRRRRPARPGPAAGLPPHLHESLLRGLWQLLRPAPRRRRAAPAPAPAAAPARGAVAPRRLAAARRDPRAGLGLRLWGVRQGLPFVYNIDEADHFVPRAVGDVRRHDLNPHYFANPPAFTYVLHDLFARLVRRRLGAVRHALRAAPDRRSTRSRASPPRCSARSRCGFSTRAGARLFDRARRRCSRRRSRRSRSCRSSTRTWRSTTCRRSRRLTLSLLGSAGVLRHGRVRDYLLAGAGLGLAVRDQVHGRDLLLPLLAAAAARYLDGRREARAGARAARWAAWRSRAPPPVVAFSSPTRTRCSTTTSFRHELVHQSTLSAEAQGKLGAPRRRRPALLPVVADVGARLGCRRWRRSAARSSSGAARRAVGWMLVPAAAAVPRLHGPAGALLRPLAAAGLPDPVPAGRAVRGAPSPTPPRAGCAPRVRGPRRRGRRQAAARPARLVAARCSPPACSSQGAGLQRALRPGALARRHAQPHARVDARQRAGGLADRGRADRARRTGRANVPGAPRAARGRRWCKYPSAHVAHRRRRARCGRGAPRARRRSRTTSARSRPALLGYYTAPRLLLGGAAARRSPVAPSPTRARCRTRSPTTARSRATATVVYRGHRRMRAARRPRQLQLRLELRLLPAGVRAAGPDGDRLPPARRALR